MSFISLLFYPALALAGIGFYIVPARFRVHYLLALSYGFYATWSPLCLLLLLAVTAITHVLALKIADAAKESDKRTFLYLGLGAVAGLLIGFKFAGVFNGVLLPLGLSYYSFKLLSYLIEVYWDEQAVEREFSLVLLYPAFFPQIVSGPIQRPGDFFAQMRAAAAKRADYTQIEEGFRLILGGLMLKLLIGERLHAFTEIVDKSPGDYTWPVLLTTICCYTLQLYADFSGYTNIAIGIGKVFGIDSPPNFNAPFAAANIQLLWRRWHMSLTSWLTDYLFTPLLTELRNLGTVGLVFCITVNMVAIGLWHGFTLNFLAFGLCHAFFLTVTVLTLSWRDRLFGKGKVARIARATVGIPLTFALMTFSQIFFFTGTWEAATTHLKILLGLMPAGPLDFRGIRSDVADPLFLCMALTFFIGAGAPGMKYISAGADRVIPNWVQYGFYLLLLSALTTEAGSSFIYGQF